MESISLAELIHNHHLHSITSQFPFFLMIGYEPHAPTFHHPKLCHPHCQNKTQKPNYCSK